MGGLAPVIGADAVAGGGGPQIGPQLGGPPHLVNAVAMIAIAAAGGGPGDERAGVGGGGHKDLLGTVMGSSGGGVWLGVDGPAVLGADGGGDGVEGGSG
jgi:hypothetical protein